MSVSTNGTVAAGFESLTSAFTESFDGKPNMGAALSVWHNGEPVVDLWGGIADERSQSPWLTDTSSVIFSCTKGLVSILAAMLVSEGKLDYEAPVSHYWPEFAVNGKEAVRVKHLLGHRSGVSAPRQSFIEADVLDWHFVVSALAAQEPLWEPGAGYAYHAITHGWLAGEVIRRITGESVGSHFAHTIAEPLEAELWIGLPEHARSRVAHMQVGSTLSQLVEQQAAARTPGVMDWSAHAMTLGGAFAPELVTTDGGFNSPRVQAAEIPGAGGIGTARALAKIWSATVTETSGVRLVDDETLELATTVQSEGAPVWDVPGPWPRWGMGLQLDSEARRYLTPAGFGHDGAGGQVAFADPESGIGFAYLTNQMEAIDDVRATRIVDALRKVLAS
jgi:CubicO group peptidase (beta-lactamase class C family)